MLGILAVSLGHIAPSEHQQPACPERQQIKSSLLRIPTTRTGGEIVELQWITRLHYRHICIKHADRCELSVPGCHPRADEFLSPDSARLGASVVGVLVEEIHDPALLVHRSEHQKGSLSEPTDTVKQLSHLARSATSRTTAGSVDAESLARIRLRAPGTKLRAGRLRDIDSFPAQS